MSKIKNRNTREESGVSLDLLKVRAEGEGVSIEELVCREGLPLEPTFGFLISLLNFKHINRMFKEYVTRKAFQLAKTDDDFIALKKCGLITPTNSTSDTTVLEAIITIPSSTFIIPSVVEEINELHSLLSSDISLKDRKAITSRLDILVCDLLKEAAKNGNKLLEIYNLLLKDNKRIPYLKQILTQLGYKEHL